MIFWILPIIILIFISLLALYLNLQIGISVLITSIGIIFTTIWLYILLPQRENRRWKFVEKEVRNELSATLRNLFEVTKGYFKNEIVGVTYEVREGINEEEIWENVRLKKFEELSNKDKLEISSTGKAILEKGNPATFLRYRKDIGNIELKYFKFMKPGEILSLIKTQKILDYLIWTIESTKVKFLRNKDEYYEDNLCKYALDLYKEIFYFHKNFMPLYPKPNNQKP